MTKLSPSEQKFIQALQCSPQGFEFRNWSGTFRSQPEFYLAPETETQIIELIRIANRHHLTIKPIGSGHSPSDIACTNSMMLSMDKMNRILAHDPYTCTLTVESGVRLHQLHEMLQQRNMALSSVGSISDQSIAGAIATATHGSGIFYGDLSSVITHLVIIDGNGIRHECDRDSEGDLFDAARCSLGALGIITQVTVQCEPAFNLHAVQVPENLDDVLNNLTEVVESAEHVRVWWFPHTDDTVVWRANRSNMAAQKSPHSYIRDHLYGFHYYQLQLYKARCTPDDVPRLAHEHFQNRFARRLEWIDESHRVFNFDCLFPQYVNEWAIPWERAPDALRQLRIWINKEARNAKGVRVHFPVEIRFVKESDVWLSPTYGQKVCYIGVIMYRPYGRPVPYKKYWRAYEDVMRTLGGRPHWAKAHGMFYYDFVKLYPRFREFVDLRNRCDPNGVFVNDYIRRHVLPPDHPLTTAGSAEEEGHSITLETAHL